MGNITDIGSVIAMCFVAIFTIILMFAMFYHMIPHGDLTEHTGYIEDVDYSQGGYATPSATFVTWQDGFMQKIQGNSNMIRKNCNATITFLDGEEYDYFKEIEYYD